MQEVIQGIKNILRKELVILWIFSVLLGLSLIVLQIKHKLPLGKGDFVFISILLLCIALYRPRWIFFLFISLIPLENIFLASGFLPIQMRPYQYAGGILAGAVIILWIVKRLKFKMLKPSWLDWLIFSLAPLSLLSLLNSSNRSIGLKNDLILISFLVLYYLIRNFVRNREDLIKSIFFFFGSNIVVLTYGFYQVFADKIGARSFEVMFGRPNATFTEPDWLGIYLCFALAVFFAIISCCNPERSRGICVEKQIASHSANTQIPPRVPINRDLVGMTNIIIYFLVFLNLILLILTLSRSAWLGAGAIVFFFLFFGLYKKEKDKIIFTPRKFTENFVIIFLISLFVFAVIHYGKLSKFDIFDRARSAATSEQKITIACESNVSIPPVISSTDELAKYGCQHINLENIDYYKSRGKYVTTIFRKDPNVMTRSQIYRKSFEIIHPHSILGIGFGTITQALGIDERGAGLNESNIFLQIWAGSGILGLIAFITILGYLFVHSFRRISPVCPLDKIIGCPIVKDYFERSLNIFVLLGLIALGIPNLFNAGLFMGTFWLGLGIILSAVLISSTKSELFSGR